MNIKILLIGFCLLISGCDKKATNCSSCQKPTLYDVDEQKKKLLKEKIEE